MKKNLLQRLIIIAVVTLIAFYIILWPRDHRPTLQDFTYAGIKNTLRNNIRLGLDLRGGTHLVMQVQVPDYLTRLTAANALAAQTAAREAGSAVSDATTQTSENNYSFSLAAQDASTVDAIRDAVQRKVDLSVWSVSTSGNTITWSLSSSAQRDIGRQAVTQALNVIESRINAFGVAEPTLQIHGAESSNQILLQMPGLQDTERLKALIAGESRLELVHVVSQPNPAPVQTYTTEQEAIASLNSGGTVPPNRRVLRYLERDEPTAADNQANQNQDRPARYVVVEAPEVVNGAELRSAQAVSETGRDNDYQISFALKPAGAEKFGRWTGANINQYMGVVLNDEVRNIAFIRSQITDSGEISGRFTRQSAEETALVLRSGALPARIAYTEQRTVGPTLGADSIRSGVAASIAGLLFVMAFMLFYYRGSGVNAIVALILNIVLLVAAMIIFGATLTLPGIAGIILTIGMAVDSNVLIFERIREELQTGKTVASAVEQGFNRAFVTIIDTHITTIISSLFLFIFGTGPIRGFAVSLVIGLVANLFTAIFVSRTIFIWLLNRKGRRAESLSI